LRILDQQDGFICRPSGQDHVTTLRQPKINLSSATPPQLINIKSN